jgi:hypothetical protein
LFNLLLEKALGEQLEQSSPVSLAEGDEMTSMADEIVAASVDISASLRLRCRLKERYASRLRRRATSAGRRLGFGASAAGCR